MMFKIITKFSLLIFPLIAIANESNFLQGDWKVASLRVDLNNPIRMNFQSDDDRVVGRFFKISLHEINTNIPVLDKCLDPVYKKKTTTLGQYIKETSGEDYGTPASDFDLQKAAGEAVTVFSISCAGNISDKLVLPSLAIDKNNDIYTLWGENNIVILKPDNDNVIKASYNCSKATLLSEKTICSSSELTAYDLSVSRSWNTQKEALQRLGLEDKLDELKENQKVWLKSRNKCNSDQACLKKSMIERLGELSDVTNNEG